MRVRKLIVAVGVVALAVAGCGSKVEGTAVGGPAAKPAKTSSTASEPTSETTTTTSKKAGGGGNPAGTGLAVGETATIPYATTVGGKVLTKLDVTAVSVEKGSIAELEKKFELDAQTKASAPFYVTMKFRNVGDKAAETRGIFGVINAYNSAGDELGQLTLYGEFKTCEGSPPDSLAPNAEYSHCVVYVAPAGGDVAKVVLSNYADDEKVEVSWGAA